MIIEQAVLKALADNAGMAALVGNRIYYVKAPQDVTAPYVVINKISAVSYYSYVGSSHLCTSRLQLNTFGATYAIVKQIGAAMRLVLDAFSGTLGGVGGLEVSPILFDNEIDLPFDDDLKLYGLAQDFRAIHRE